MTSDWGPERLRALDVAVAEASGWRWWRSSETGRRCLYAPGKNPSWMQTPADGTEPLVWDWPALSQSRYFPTWSAGCRETFELQREARIKVHPMCANADWPDPWWAEYVNEPDGWRNDNEAPTAPIAICLAYLAFKGIRFNE